MGGILPYKGPDGPLAPPLDVPRVAHAEDFMPFGELKNTILRPLPRLSSAFRLPPERRGRRPPAFPAAFPAAFLAASLHVEVASSDSG